MLGKVLGLWRYPVKSMLGEELSEVSVTPEGFAGDRGIALVDAATMEMVSCKQPKLWGRLFELSASLAGVTFPDGTLVEYSSLEEPLSEFLGRDVLVVGGDEPFFDVAPLHLMATGTLAAMAALQPKSRFEVARFRPNVLIGCADGFGGELRLGSSVLVRVECGAERCVMTTLPQGDLPADKLVLQTIVKHRQNELGVYAVVLEGGLLRVGDEVTIA